MAAETDAGFDQFGLAEPILKAVREVGYETPSPIQRQAIKSLLEGRDVLGQAQTGTGKTAAFALPVLSRIDLSRLQPQVLVLTPTRELAGACAGERSASQELCFSHWRVHRSSRRASSKSSTQLKPLMTRTSRSSL